MTSQLLRSSYDGFTLFTTDQVYQRYFQAGECEPYPLQLPVVKRFLSDHPNRNQYYVDAGACIGTTVLPYSRLFAKGMAFEPDPHSYNLLEVNLVYNRINNVEIFNQALSDRSYWGGSRYYGDNCGMNLFREAENGKFQAVTLDSKNLPGLDYLKIDTEGTEILVLKGAEASLRKFKPLIQLEVNGCAERNFGLDSREISSWLSKLGYRIYDNSDPYNPFYYL